MTRSGLALGARLLAGISSAPTQAPAPVAAAVRLEVGTTSEKTIAGGEVRVFEMALLMGQFIKVIPDQKGVDVVRTVLAPDGTKHMEVDSSTPATGTSPGRC
jgi:hypothetical protein